MDVVAKIPYQCEISFKNGVVRVIGSLPLIEKMQNLKTTHGHNPMMWPGLAIIATVEDLLINEFILKTQGKFKLSYEHLELCHCRQVPADRVYDAIKQNCQTVTEVGRATKAGTGCGSCRVDIEKLITQFRFS